MPTEPANAADPRDFTMREDEPIPRASDEEVIEETARMARDGLKQLDADPNEPRQRDRGE